MGVRWDMLQPVDVAGKVQQGFDEGMKRRAQLETQRAMAALQAGPNPEALRALYTYNPELAMQVEDQLHERSERKRETDFRGATANMLLGGGQPAPGIGGGMPQMNALASPPTSTPAFGGSNVTPQMGAAVPARNPLAPSPAPIGVQRMGPSPAPTRSPAYEQAVRADPEKFLTFQGNRLDVSEKQLKNYRDLNDMGMQILGSVNDQATYDAAKQRAAQLYSSHGQDASEFLATLPAEYSPEVIRSLQLQGMDTSKQLQAIIRENRLDWDIEDDEIDNEALADYRSQQIGVRRRGQDISSRDRRRGQDKRTGLRSKPPTPTIVIGRIMDKQARGETLSGAERQVLEDHRAGKGRGGKSNRSDLIGQVYQRGGKRIQYSKSKGGYVDVATGEVVK